MSRRRRGYHHHSLNYRGKNLPRSKRGMNYYVTKARYYSRNKIHKPLPTSDDMYVIDYEKSLSSSQRVL